MIQTSFILFENEVIEDTSDTSTNTTTEIVTPPQSEYEIDMINHLDSIYIVCIVIVFCIGTTVGTLLGKMLWRGATV